MSWFIIAKDDADAGRWGCPAECLCLVVGSDGSIATFTVGQIVNEQAKLPSAPFLAVLNIEEYPQGSAGTSATERGAILNSIREAIPAQGVEGLFVHFGGYDPEVPTSSREEVQNKWHNPETYPGLADVFEDIDVFPYSVEAGATWSAKLRTLATMLEPCTKSSASIASKLPEWRESLKNARALAYQRYGNQRDVSKNTKRRSAARALMPAFIYLDGLLYAHGIADSADRDEKVKGMEDVIRTDMKGVLEGISVPLRQSSPKAIQDVVAELVSDQGELRELAAKFCHEYRDFLKAVMPESAVLKDTTQEPTP